MSDKDKALAKEYLKKWGADNCITMYEGLDALIETFASALATARKEAEKDGRLALAAELLGHLDRITSTTAAHHFIRNICKIELGQEPDSLGAEIDH